MAERGGFALARQLLLLFYSTESEKPSIHLTSVQLGAQKIHIDMSHVAHHEIAVVYVEAEEFQG